MQPLKSAISKKRSEGGNALKPDNSHQSQGRAFGMRGNETNRVPVGHTVCNWFLQWTKWGVCLKFPLRRWTVGWQAIWTPLYPKLFTPTQLYGVQEHTREHLCWMGLECERMRQRSNTDKSSETKCRQVKRNEDAANPAEPSEPMAAAAQSNLMTWLRPELTTLWAMCAPQRNAKNPW